MSGVDQELESGIILFVLRLAKDCCYTLLHDLEGLPECSRHHEIACICTVVVAEPVPLELVVNQPLIVCKVICLSEDALEVFRSSSVSVRLEGVEVGVFFIFSRDSDCFLERYVELLPLVVVSRPEKWFI